MRVNSLKLKNFRNYGELEVEFDHKRNIIIGENAQGKTNLIEAIYLCAFARSFRTSNSTDLIKIGEENCNVSVEAVSEDIDKKISITINNRGKKMIKKDNKFLSRTAELLNNLVVVVFSPDDLRIIKDSPEKRRNFIDKEISQLRPSYFEALRNYKDVLKQKNSLIKQLRAPGSESKMRDMLEIYDMQLAKYGSEIIKIRREFVEMLSEKASKIQNNISKGRENLEIKYVESVAAENILDEIINSRERDIYNGHCSIGPHRDDLDFYINGIDAKKFGSQGQQRTVALSLKLAEIQLAEMILGENAVLLLDDVLSELDRERQSYLLNEIEDVQLFLTSTEVNSELLHGMKEGKVFNVKSGSLV